MSVHIDWRPITDAIRGFNRFDQSPGLTHGLARESLSHRPILILWQLPCLRKRVNGIYAGANFFKERRVRPQYKC
jgi:hypothetical protein